MDKNLISVDFPNVISVGIIVAAVLVLYALLANYGLKWTLGRSVSDNSGSGY